MPEINKNIFVLDKDNKTAEGAKRKMAAIFAADVVGYSKLMAYNEKLTLFRLKETRKITDKIIGDLNGRIFSTAGDSIMAEFASPVDALETAINIQKEISAKAKEVKDNIAIEFRIGINLGDIMTQDDNLYGDNVNIAARLESISAPGEITISEKVFQEVEDKVDINFKYQGEKKLKNIAKKIKVYTSQMTSENTTSNNFSIRKINKVYFVALSVIFILILMSFFYFKNNFSQKIEYTDNSQSVLENFRASQDNVSTSNEVAGTGKIILALMQLQNQSKILNSSKIDEIISLIDSTIIEQNDLAVVKTPQGSENLNPPEVMLIATESNASFVINGIIYDEKGSSLLNLKIYEAKRGSLIVNKKLVLENSNQNLYQFISNFSKDIVKK